jgi:hypothetical protein
MVAEIFYVRLFIYGLVGFVQGPGQITTVLLPNQDQHDAFVAFNDGTCTPQCKGIGPKKVNGFPLTGNEISWKVDQIIDQGNQRQARPPIIHSLPQTFDTTLPIAPIDSAAFDWVAPMGQLVGNGAVNGDCTQGPSTNCNKPNGLAGRIALTSGLVSTCRLIETGTCDPSGQSHVHTYTFQPPFQPTSPQVEQALAEIELVVTAVSGSSVTLTLTELGKSAVQKQAVLIPAPCVGGDPKTKPNCVDIFIGNMLRSNSCDQLSGDHFKALYGLLASQPTGTLPIPIQDTGHEVLAADVQPWCQDVPSGPAARTPEERQALAQLRDLRRLTEVDISRARKFEAYLLHFYPNQRPICPMGAFNPPA